MTENEAIAFVAFFMMLGAVGIALIVSRHLARRLQSREIVKALEHGQQLPLPPQPRRSFVQDLRVGVLLITFALGFGLFIRITDGREVVALALVPLFLGFGYLINAVLTQQFSDEPEPAPAPPSIGEPATADRSDLGGGDAHD